jgi:uncharacterized protein YbjT (DUF2867 family)
MILVTGATGHIGKELIPLLLESGQSMRIVVRDEKKVAHLDPRIERMTGDLNKPESLLSAMHRVEKSFWSHLKRSRTSM